MKMDVEANVSLAANAMDNSELSDTELMFTVRDALASVKNGDSDNYTHLIGILYLKEYSDSDAVAQLELILKALSSSVACLDEVHHRVLLSAIFRMSLWDHNPNIMDALVGLIISLAVTSGKYLDPCLNMLMGSFIPPPFVIHKISQPRMVRKKQDVFSRVHAALERISYLVPLAPSRLVSVIALRMPKVHVTDPMVLIFVENLLKLENSSIGKVVGNVIIMVVMERLRDLDLDIEWDDILQDDSSRGMFDMELEDEVEGAMNEGGENQKSSDGNAVSELLDKLMILSFNHLESCQDAGRLEEVFDILFESFENFILNTYKSKFSQFLMFYACSLDPKNCGEKFATKLLDIYLSNDKPRLTRMSAVAYLASYLSRGKFLSAPFVAKILKRLVEECADYCKRCDDDIRPEAHQVFYSGCQAILYVLCFRMRYILDVPRFEAYLEPLESILSHRLSPLMVCLPSVVAEFLKQAKASGLFIVSEAFIFDDLLESELSRAFGGFERLDTFFPFDPCMLKMSNSVISRHFIYWSNVKEDAEDDDDCPEVIVTGDDSDEEDSDGDVDLGNEMNKMSITPKHSFMRETEKLSKMPSRLRPSTSPRESL